MNLRVVRSPVAFSDTLIASYDAAVRYAAVNGYLTLSPAAAAGELLKRRGNAASAYVEAPTSEWYSKHVCPLLKRAALEESSAALAYRKEA